MFWKIIGILFLLAILSIFAIVFYGFKEFFYYMIGDEEEDGYYDQEIAAINRESDIKK